MFFVVGGMPIMALAFVGGGISWSYLLWFFAIAVLVSLFSASIGIFCSSICQKSISAVIMSYGIYVIFMLGTLIPWCIETIAVSRSQTTVFINSIGFFLINPAYYLLEFFVWMMSGNSLAYEIYDGFSSSTFFTKDIVHYGWMILSSVLLILISFIFLRIAAKRISPISKKQAKKLSQRGQ
jgi:hypothetical protein